MNSAAPSAPAYRRFYNGADSTWHVPLTQGEYRISRDPGEALTTVLGSCIAACIRDPLTGIGGMNHFLLPEDRGGGGDAARYGAHAMEMLINALLAQGAQRGRLEAKLFGGAAVVAGLSDVGAANARFAQAYLIAEGLAYAGGDLGGACPRRIQYWPVSGRARQLALPRAQSLAVVESERTAASRPQEGHDVELF